MQIKCDCGKLLAKGEGKQVYLWCKSCKKEIPFSVKNTPDGSIILTPLKK